MKAIERTYHVSVITDPNNKAKAFMHFCSRKDCVPENPTYYLGFFLCKIDKILKNRYTMLRTINKKFNKNYERLEYIFNNIGAEN